MSWAEHWGAKFPDNGQVRNGVAFGPNGNQTGTLVPVRPPTSPSDQDVSNRSWAEHWGAKFPDNGQVQNGVAFGPNGDQTGALISGYPAGGGTLGEGFGRGIINRMRQQIACYWPLIGYDQFSQPLYGDIVELRVRWDGSAVQYNDPNGQQLVSNAIVYPGIPIEIGSLFIPVSLNFVSDVNVPANNDNVFEAKQLTSTPNLRNTATGNTRRVWRGA